MTPSATAVLQIQEADGAADARWVIAARTGDPDATLRLLNRYRPPLLRLLTGLAGDLATAEDLVQESLLQAFRRLTLPCKIMRLRTASFRRRLQPHG
jgi:DNA-directed RNA polymerase specialized sigma24 family protein